MNVLSLSFYHISILWTEYLFEHMNLLPGHHHPFRLSPSKGESSLVPGWNILNKAFQLRSNELKNIPSGFPLIFMTLLFGEVPSMVVLNETATNVFSPIWDSSTRAIFLFQSRII